MTSQIGRTAVEIADDVRAGRLMAREVVQEHLDRIAALDGRVGAFMVVRAEAALVEADVVDGRPDRASLPLAGVPVAVKDNIPLAGHPTRHGSPMSSTQPAAADHVVVERLRAAGAVVVGTTRVPELCIWPVTDGPLGTTRNPWNLDRTSGGSSGGSAAAVASGFVPLAHGADGMGSIRIPAACCGLVGLKPGHGSVPANLGVDSWTAMAENGPLATTVADAALGLSVMAGDPALANISRLGGPQRVGLVVASPAPGVRVDASWRQAALDVADALSAQGHEVSETSLPTPLWMIRGGLARWVAGAEADAALAGPDRTGLPRRTRTHTRLGRVARRLGWVRPEDTQRWRTELAPLFSRHDVVLSPALAAPPPPAAGHASRSWLANYRTASAFTGGLQAPWNIAGYPSIAVPAGLHPDGTPLSVLLSAPLGGEALLLSLSAQLEAARPWTRRPAFATHA